MWQRYPLVAVPKSRRMTMSWTVIGLMLWDTIFHVGRNYAFVSKKEDDAHELVMRAKFIIDNMNQQEIPPELIPKYNDKFCSLEFPEIRSQIRGYPQGADQLRQFTFSGILGDETAFWEHAQKFYAASFPTIDGGGRMTLISSPAPGFFKRLVYDQIDDESRVIAIPKGEVHSPGTGIKSWINPKNRFLIFELHYTADPDKRADLYKESIKNSMPHMEYMREYELQWDTFEGMPVYPEFSKMHITMTRPVPDPGLPMIICFDFGLTPAAVIMQLQEDRLFVFKEIIETNMGTVRFAERVKRIIQQDFRTFSDLKKDWLCFIDPSGNFRKDTDENTCAKILAESGFSPIPGALTWEERRHAVVGFLRGMTKDGPAIQIYEPGCPTLIEGFQGGYRFSDKASEIEPTKLRPVKDSYSHVHDALQYGSSGINKTKRTYGLASIPVPHYKLTQENSHAKL